MEAALFKTATVSQPRAVPPAAGFKEVLVPGDPEARTRPTRQRDGVPIPDYIWQSITELAASLDIKRI